MRSAVECCKALLLGLKERCCNVSVVLPQVFAVQAASLDRVLVIDAWRLEGQHYQGQGKMMELTRCMETRN